MLIIYFSSLFSHLFSTETLHLLLPLVCITSHVASLLAKAEILREREGDTHMHTTYVSASDSRVRWWEPCGTGEGSLEDFMTL